MVAEISCEFYLPAAFDDLLTLRTTIEHAKGARISHQYEVFRDGDLLARGKSIVACVDRTGRPKRIPQWLMADA